MDFAKQVTTSVFALGILCFGLFCGVNFNEVQVEEQKQLEWQEAQERALEREKITKEIEARDKQIEQQKAEEEAKKKAEAEAKAKAEAEAKKKAEEEAKKKEQEQAQAQYTPPANNYNGAKLTKLAGTIQGPSGKETYYNLPMEGVISIMRGMGNNDKYWVRDDGVKMLGDYVMIAAALDIRPRGSLVQTSLGMGIVCDTGGFAYHNPTQIDIAVAW